MFFLLCNFCFVFLFGVVNSVITDEQYASMPQLFHMDNYDMCMLLKEKSLFCTFTYEIQPNNLSQIWNIIQEVSSDKFNYRHDHLRHAICVPQTCPNVGSRLDEQSLQKQLSQCYDNKYKNLNLNGTITGLRCLTYKSKYPIETIDIIIAFFCLSYIAFVVIASFYEGIARYKTKEQYELLTGRRISKIICAFSIPKNWYRLTAPTNNPEFKRLSCIQGIRFYNMICVILAHTVMLALAGPVSNPKYVENMTQKVLNMFLANGGYAVQSYFLISGWLLSYHFFQMFEHKKNVKFSYIILAFVNRYIRLTPTLAVIIAFHSTWMVHVSNGPFWEDTVGEDYKNCRKNWWLNLLYINNYVDVNNMCLHQSWYIASDTQLFLLSLIILMIVWNCKSKAIPVFSSVIFTGILINGIISYLNDYDIVVRQYPETVYKLKSLRLPEWTSLYASGHSNIGGYTIGLLFGYLYYQYKETTIFTNKVYVVLWWFLTFGMCISIILIASPMYDKDFTYSRLGAAAYWAFGKNLFALGIAIGIFGMSQGIGYFARWITEWSSVQVLGRLTYSAYLVHTSVVRIRGGTIRYPVFLTDYQFLFTNVSDLVMSYLMATVLCLLFEMPISALQKLWIPQLDEKRINKFSNVQVKELTYCDKMSTDSTNV